MRTISVQSKLMKSFYKILFNTLFASVTVSFLWFALTFWVYLETRSVMATAILGGGYMLLVALSSLFFGTFVDKHKKKTVMVLSSILTLAAFAIAGILYLVLPHQSLSEWSSPLFWLFGGVILLGAVLVNLRNIALSTVVTLLVEKEKRANANGLVGAVQGVGFLVTSVFSGLAIGFLGMGWTLAIAITVTALALIHLLFVRIPEDHIEHDPELTSKNLDIKGSLAAIMVVPGLIGLLLFSTFNNLLGGVYMSLLDPYGLTLFSVQLWGIVLGITSIGFIIGGAIVGKFGLGKNPLKTLLIALIVMAVVGALFTIQEFWPLFLVGMLIYMCIVPIIEATEQTVIQRVVPFKKQGRVFGFAASIESAAAPITAFLIGPLAEFMIIPYMDSDAGKTQLGWLLGQGDARGIALVFLIAGFLLLIAAILAFGTKSYKRLSKFYNKS